MKCWKSFLFYRLNITEIAPVKKGKVRNVMNLLWKKKNVIG